VIDGEDAERRDQCFAQYILQTLQELPVHQTKVTEKWQQAKIPNELLEPSKQVLDKDQYKDELSKLTKKVADALRYDDRKVIVALEGMDAAGKGGAIKRIVKKLDPREYEIHTIGAPERYELRRPYLWRFWNKLNDGEKITIFDRTWYGRVLVERIEEYATTVEWQRAYDEINRFEQSLVDSQTIVVKIWLAISKDEQAVRFKEREETPHKRFKITPEDWRNREKWDDYLNAAADMFERTNTDYAPWYVIATDDKNTARIEVLKAILKQLKAD
jgi:polyphosphate kinase 2 (PPK2 family)